MQVKAPLTTISALFLRRVDILQHAVCYHEIKDFRGQTAPSIAEVSAFITAERVPL